MLWMLIEDLPFRNRSQDFLDRLYSCMDNRLRFAPHSRKMHWVCRRLFVASSTAPLLLRSESQRARGLVVRTSLTTDSCPAVPSSCTVVQPFQLKYLRRRNDWLLADQVLVGDRLIIDIDQPAGRSVV